MAKVISLIVPCLNEEENVAFFYNEITKVFQSLSGYDFEMIFIDDGSTDGTLSEIKSLHAKDNRVKLVKFSRNFGKEIALAAGIDHVQGDAAIPMDVDMQDPPELIKQFIQKWEEGYDVVYGVRETRKGDPLLKKITAHWFYRVLNYLSDTPIPTDTGDFRLVDKKVVVTLQQMKEKNRFMKGIFAWVGYRQIGVPYERVARREGTTKFNFMRLLSLAFEGITSFSVKPLRLASLFGILISLIAFLYGLFIITRSVIYGADVPGYPSLLVAILFLGGIQLISIGLLGEYMGKTYNESKARPLYIVSEKLGY